MMGYSDFKAYFALLRESGFECRKESFSGPLLAKWLDVETHLPGLREYNIFCVHKMWKEAGDERALVTPVLPPLDAGEDFRGIRSGPTTRERKATDPTHASVRTSLGEKGRIKGRVNKGTGTLISTLR